MSANLEFCLGKVHVFKQGNGDGAGTGFYALKPPIDVGSGGKVLVVGVPLSLSEIAQPVVTLDDRRMLYTFGAAWSTGAVQLKVLLGESSGGGAAMGAVADWYKANRLSTLKKPVELSVANKGYDVYIVGMTVGAADSNNNTQDVTLTFMISDD